MLFKGTNGKMHSTLSGEELLAINDIKDPCQLALETDAKVMNLFDEMFGQDSAFMDDNFGG